MYYLCVSFFFFFNQNTAYDLRNSDWSSDVCSSDLSPCRACSTPAASLQRATTGLSGAPAWRPAKCSPQPMSKPQFAGCRGATSKPRSCSTPCQAPSDPSCGQLPPPSAKKVGSAAGRERGCQTV